MKKLTLLFGAFVLALTSCSKTDDVNTDAPILLKTLSDGTTVATLTYSGNKIVKDENNSTYTYTGDLITTELMTYTNSFVKWEYTFNGNGQLTSQVSSSNNGTGTDFIPSSKKEYTYNSDGTVTVQYYNYADSTFTESGTGKYTFENGNLIKDEYFEVDGSKTGEYDYEYDSKNNPSHNIKGFDKFFEPQYCKNNITKESYTAYPSSAHYTDVNSITYTYNDKGYPLTMQATRVITNGAAPGTPSTTNVNLTYGY